MLTSKSQKMRNLSLVFMSSRLGVGTVQILRATMFGEFYERLPQNPIMRQDMPRRLCLEEFEVLQAGPFAYFLNSAEHLLMVTEFRRAKSLGLFPEPRRCEKLTQLAVSKTKNL